MIEPRFVRVMARYNMWQNASLVDAADALGEGERQRQRGAFFGSIFGTFNHVLWGDTLWMSRFDGWTRPEGGIPDSPAFTADWQAFKTARNVADTRVLDWSLRLQVGDLDGELRWHSGALDREVAKPLWICVQHFFNHQTHHRGQIHAMLTAAGARPGDTDLFAMEEGD